ncbi:trans-sialidase, putative [Trypanosoma cruzi marinkellei]|uniref:Trans-sialidase, putative n=1 Tax=Trypanosoma cruzi marinkellei TaxID=85056 RepID=K2MUP2_TRYCR|nr:trans-sialidase, putative [Trypanosoma cruzi marinkellei]
MHSRVAAVKVPRTHNRRRVTGSSGRRREGRESEPQAPNMSRHHFYSAVLLLLVVMMCCGSGGGAAEAAGQLSGHRFAWKDANSEGEGVTVNSLGVPGLLKVGNDVFAVAEAKCKKYNVDTTNGIASQLLTVENKKEPKEVLTDAKTKTQILGEGASDQKNKVDVSRPTAVVEGGKIYMLVGKYNGIPHDTCQRETDATESGLLLVKGNISGENGNNRIYWNDTYVIPWRSNCEQLKSFKSVIGGGGSGVKIEETLVFPVEAMKTSVDNKGSNTFSLVIYSKDTESWTLSKGMSDGGCGDPSVVGWEKDKLMMMTACVDGRRRVYESGDKGKSWTEALGTLSRVWSNKRDDTRRVRSGFTTATIDGVDDNRSVMLVTLPVYANDNLNGVLHLWLTDNTHIVDIGPVSGNDDAAASSLLYKSGEDNNKDELIALYEKKKKEVGETPSPAMASVLLTAELQQVKEVLKTWKDVDERVCKMCTNLLVPKGASTDTACSSNFNITDGLVGFLSGNFSDGIWKDEYLGVSATVRDGTAAATVSAEAAKVTKASDGVMFRGAWAEWPVGKQGENQLYHFANYNVTLVATVSIDGEPKGDTPIPLMGVRLEGEEEKSKLMELSYDKEKKWRVLCGDGTTKKLKSTWVPQTQYQVAIVLRNGTQGTVYVDGQSVGGDVQRQLENKHPKEISHFYIGGGEGSAGSQKGVSVTVTNVLLYNRPLSSEEVTALNKKLSIPKAGEINTLTGNTNAAPLADQNSDAPAGGSATTQQVPATSNSHAGEAHGDAGTYCGSGLLPLLLLLLGLWGFATL